MKFSQPAGALQLYFAGMPCRNSYKCYMLIMDVYNVNTSWISFESNYHCISMPLVGLHLGTTLQ